MCDSDRFPMVWQLFQVINLNTNLNRLQVYNPIDVILKVSIPQGQLDLLN
jgi:hypothetical protein